MTNSTRRTRRLTRSTLAMAIFAATLTATPATSHQATCSTLNVGGGDWPMMGHDVEGTRNQDKERFLNADSALRLAPQWAFDANRATNMPNNEITGYPVVAQGCVYVGSSLATFGRSGWVFGLNADNGDLVWKTEVKGGVYNTVAYEDGIVYAFVSRVSTPYVVALDADNGAVLWESTVDHQIGSDAVSSPILYDGMIWVGISGTAAEVNEGDRSSFHGTSVLLDQATGAILKTTYTIPEELWGDGFAGGAIWGTMSIDSDTGFGYVGTGNPFDYNTEHENTNALLKIDLRRTSPTLGEILETYKGTVEEYDAVLSGTVPCEELEEISGLFAAGLECLRLDLDFGTAPNIITDSSGRKLVAAGQKSGVLHVLDADTFEVVYTKILGVPSAVGGIVGSSAYDGESLYGPHTIGGYMWKVDKDDGELKWVAPVGSGVNWGPPATYSNNLIYTVDLAGFLDVFEAGTGAPLLRYPLIASPDNAGSMVPLQDRPPLSWGGVTVARRTVFVSAGVGLTSAGLPSLPSGFVIAFRPRALPV